jgi:hypothetical protein
MVGGTTTIFTLVNAVLLRPLPYPAADRLVIVESTQPNGFGTNVTLADSGAFQAGSRAFDLWGRYRPGYVAEIVQPDKEPLLVQDMRVTPDVFPMLGIGVERGRTLLASDSDPAAPAVAVIGHDLWLTRFGGRDDAIGQSLTMGRESMTIVGVARRGANVPTNWLSEPMVWRALRQSADPELRFTTLARLRDGATLERARAELALLADRLANEHPDTHKGRVATVTGLLDEIVGSFKRVL